MNEILISEDGSHTLRSELFGVTYHSIHGAITEGKVVYIEAGLKYVFDQGLRSINLFEMGFGSGLNALLSLEFAKLNNCHIFYTGIEMYPLATQEYEALNYPAIFTNPNVKSAFLDMHKSLSEEIVVLDEHFTFKKIIGKLEDFTSQELYDVIYFDAFSPDVQSNLWEREMMEKMYNMLAPNGVLTTYCAKGEFKRVLAACGFRIENLPGPPGKREITRAIKLE